MAETQMKSNDQDIITIDVGGTVFKTTKSTIHKAGDWLLANLLNERVPSEPVFIDRDPEYFRHILNYLRTSFINLSKVDVDSLKVEADYYRLYSILDAVETWRADEDKAKQNLKNKELRDKSEKLYERLKHYQNDTTFFVLVYYYYDLLKEDWKLLNRLYINNLPDNFCKHFGDCVSTRSIKQQDMNDLPFMSRVITNLQKSEGVEIFDIELPVKKMNEKIYPFDL